MRELTSSMGVNWHSLEITHMSSRMKTEEKPEVIIITHLRIILKECQDSTGLHSFFFWNPGSFCIIIFITNLAILLGLQKKPDS